MDEDAVAGLYRYLAEILVGAVHRVAGLESGNRAPALVLEYLPRLGGPEIYARVFLREGAFAQHLYGAREVDGLLLHDHRNARVLHVGRAVNLFALIFLVYLVLLGDLHRSHYLSGLLGDEGYFL